MMTRQLLLLFLLVCTTGISAFAQETVIAPCGSVGGRSAWLQRYQSNPEAYPKSLNTTLYVPLTIHLVGTDDGQGYFSVARLLDALCTLNADYVEADIQFFIEGDIRYINNSFWNSHPSVLDGAEMMFANNVPNTLNCYFVSDPAGNCGYNLPYAGIAMRKACSNADDHTWAHEVGHALSLPHPFLGWEGGVSWDDSVPHNFNDPAPLTVTYNYTYFKDTLILDTLIIDTAFVEFVDGSNCQIAADGFCDTSPDYLSDRWQCNANGQSNTVQTDPAGVQFRSDATLIMGYADDACSNRFTAEQIAAMQANLLDEKPELLYNQTPEPDITQAVTLVSPDIGDLVPFNQVELSWTPVENAMHYMIQVSRVASFPGGITFEFVSETPFLSISELENNKTYYWRVRPYNRNHTCAGFSSSRYFQTGDVSAVSELNGIDRVKLMPNPLSSSAVPLQVEFEASEQTTLAIRLLATSGQVLALWNTRVSTGRQLMELAIPDQLAPGLYLIEFSDGYKGRRVEKLSVIP